MRILLTGASGFVGRHVAQRLAVSGHTVRALTRNPQGGVRGVAGVDEVHGWDPTAAIPLARVYEGVDGIVHLAGESVVGLWTDSKRRAIRDSRVVGTRHLVQGLESLPEADRPRVLVSASAIGFYGNRGEEVLTEESPPGTDDDFLASVCRQWEHEARGAEALGLRVVRLRIGIVLGPEGGALGAMMRPFKLGLGGPLGDGRQWWSWIHRYDLATLILSSLMQEGLSGPVNGTAPEPVRQREFAQELGRVLGRPAILPAPAFALKTVLGGFSSELLASKRALPRAAEAAGVSFAFPTLGEALREIVAETAG
jgi:hypothetical protein